MIAYFDTSAVIPLVVAEGSSSTCLRIWNDSARIVSIRLLYPEARAALARAERMGRLTRRQHAAAITDLESVVAEVDHIEVTAALVRTAGDLAQAHGLRSYDAVHLAAALIAADEDFVLVTGEVDLAGAATSLGLAVVLVSN